MIGEAGAIALVVIVGSGAIPEGTFLALLAFIVIGAIIPIVMLPIGAIVLVAIFLRGNVGGAFLGWLGGLGSSGGAALPSNPASSSLSPAVYLPSKSIGSV